MEQFYRKSRKSKLSSLIRPGPWTEGKPVVTDIIGDEGEVLSLAASLEDVSQHPLAEAVVKRASELDLSLSHC